MISLLNLLKAMRVSKVLDDRTDRSHRAEAELDEQGRVDAELADVQRLPWRRPSSRVRSRVLLEIESRRYQRRHAVGLPAWPLRVAVAAAIALFIWGSPMWKSPVPAPAAETASAAPFATVQIAAEPNIGDQLRDEANAIGEDTRRAAELLLGRLPFAGY